MHGLEPRGFNELIAFAKERLFQTCRTIDVLEPEAPSNTEPTVPFSRISPVAPFVLPGQRRGDADHFSILGLNVHLTTIPTVIAGRRGFLHLPRFVQIF